MNVYGTHGVYTTHQAGGRQMLEVAIAPGALRRYNPAIPSVKGDTIGMNKLLSIVTIATAGALMGCTPLTYSDTNVVPASAISPHNSWTVAESNGFAGDGKLLDNNRATAATAMADGASVTIDLGEVSMFNLVIVDHGHQQNACAGRVAVYTSLDGKNFTHRFTGPGTRYLSYYSLVAPSLARYVRLTVVREGRQRLSIAEVYLR